MRDLSCFMRIFVRVGSRKVWFTAYLIWWGLLLGITATVPGVSCAAGSRVCKGPRTWTRGSFTIIIAQQGVLV